MASFLDPLIAFVSAHAWVAYFTLFLAALLEAVPVVGAVIPGSTIILALSALVPGGELQLGAVLAAAIAGALLGACHGREAIPARWIYPVLACRPLAEAGALRPRPIEYWPDDVLELAEALLLSK